MVASFEPLCSRSTVYFFHNTALMFTFEHAHCNAIIGGCAQSNLRHVHFPISLEIVNGAHYNRGCILFENIRYISTDDNPITLSYNTHAWYESMTVLHTPHALGIYTHTVPQEVRTILATDNLGIIHGYKVVKSYCPHNTNPTSLGTSWDHMDALALQLQPPRMPEQLPP